ncbi:MAG: glycosyl transferase family 1, partial [Paludibacter sp.]|nr:glycosyl transferase family 1 [Paludibacter sp.]
LQEICSQNADFQRDLEIKLVGKVDFSVMENIRNCNLENNLNKIDYMPHSEAIAAQQSSQILLLPVNNSPNAKGILTGKFYEYLASGRPILATGPTDGDMASVMAQTRAGKIVDFDDLETMKKTVLEFYNQFKNNKLQTFSENIAQYSRRNLTQKYAELLEK